MIIVSRFCDSRRRSRNYTGGGAGGRAQIFVQLRRVWFWIVVNTWINYKENKFGIVASDRLLTVVNRNRAIYSTNLHVRYVLMSVTKGYKGCTYLFVLSGEGGGGGGGDVLRSRVFVFSNLSNSQVGQSSRTSNRICFPISRSQRYFRILFGVRSRIKRKRGGGEGKRKARNASIFLRLTRRTLLFR